MAIPNVFYKTDFSSAFSANTWGDMSHFADDYQWTHYYFESNTLGAGSSIWNHAVALKLVMNKCNAMQAQIDALTGGVDMASILSAMLAAKFEELQAFIGIEDAYRVALWNAPFNADFYAALARGFQKWP